MKHTVQPRLFEKVDFNVAPLPTDEYENCLFKNCYFSNANLSGFIFDSCEFLSSNLSLANLGNTVLRDVRFADCKLLGLRFDDCNQFGISMSFTDCVLNYSSFFRVRQPKSVFKNVLLHDVDFSESDFSGAVFDNCDLQTATFDRTNLEKADFRTAFNYRIDPTANKVKKARFSLPAVVGLLDGFNIVIES